MNDPTVDHLSKVLQNCCQSAEMAECLDDWGCDVFNGGCLVLALALQRVLKIGDLFALYTWLEDDQMHQPQHVVLRVGEWYLDGNGVSGYDELTAHWLEAEGLEIDEVAPITVEESLDSFCGVYSNEAIVQISLLLSAAMHDSLIAWAHEQHTQSDWYILSRA